MLRRALEEAQLRGAPLRVLTTWQSRFTDIHDNQAAADRRKQAKAELDRCLVKWEREYPDVDMRAVAVHCNIIDYLIKNADSIQLVVVGQEHADGIRSFVGTSGYAALHHGRVFGVDLEPQNIL